MNSSATAAVIGSLSGGFQALLMVAALLGVALAVDPIAAIGVLALGFGLLQILRPLNDRTRRANRELSKVTRAMATQTTEYTRLTRDFRLFGVEAPVMDRLRGSIQDTGQVYRMSHGSAASLPSCTSPSHSESSSWESSSWPVQGHAALETDGVVLILVLRSVSYGSAVQNSIQGLRSSQGLLEDLMVDLHRFDDARVTPGVLEPESFEVQFDPWTTPTTG